MKKILLVILLMMPMMAHADLPEILGVSFGSSYNDTKSILDYRFGKSGYRDGNELSYYDVSMGGMSFQVACFSFTNNRLTYAALYNSYNLNNLTAAKNFRERIKNTYSQKYNLRTAKDKSGYIFYYADFSEDEETLQIEISTSKSENKKHQTKYFSGVYYYYESDTVNKEILDDF